MSKISAMSQKARDMPDNLRLASIGAWRGRERGMAVFAGVFLASLVITTVLAYGVGLSQVFFQESLEEQIFDAKIEFKKAPSEGTSGWTNNTSTMVGVCDELTAMDEFSDCTVVFGKKGLHSALDFGNEEIFKSVPLIVDSINSTDEQGNGLKNWETTSFEYEYTTGPPTINSRAISFLGPGAFDEGVLADRYSANIIYDMGEWSSPEVVEERRGVFLPSDLASDAGAAVGDEIDKLTFLYTTVSAEPGGLEEDDCDGEIFVSAENGFMHCQKPMTITNLTVLGIYEPWPQGNPSLPANPIYTTWTVLEDEDRIKLMDSDHFYLGVTIDRSLLPTTSTDDAAEWLEGLRADVEGQSYAGGEIELYYVDIISGTILFLNIFLALIQTFDYIIMIPIVVLSLSVLVYGLILSLEQRRREISIHRVIGATSKGLRGMILLELGVISFVAWLIGYLLAMAAVPVVLASVGFMQFSSLGYSVDPRLSLVSTIFTALTTLGLALIFGRSRAKDFMEIEIDEGVSRVQIKNKPKVWLHWTMLFIGMLAVMDTWLEMNGSEDGLYSNFFLEGLLGIFGPFFLWIGGALLLGRIGAAGPKIMLFFFGRSSLLSDVKRGLKGSGSTESVNRLAVIMLLTLSIVTLAAVQGYTGTVVDEKTASATVGSDLQVVAVDNLTAEQIESAIIGIGGEDITAEAVSVPLVLLKPEDGDSLPVYVLMNDTIDIMDWDAQAVPGSSVSEALKAYSEGGFSAGEDAAYALDLWGSGREGDSDSGDDLLSESDDRSENKVLIWEEYNFSLVEIDDGEEENLIEMMLNAFEKYGESTTTDLSDTDLSGQDLSQRDFHLADLTGANLSGTDLSGADLSQALLVGANLNGANLTGANLTNAIIWEFEPSFIGTQLDGAKLSGAWGDFTLNQSNVTATTICPDNSLGNDTACSQGPSQNPPPLAAAALSSGVKLQYSIIEHNSTMRYIGTHQFIPGISTEFMEGSLIIGETSFREFVGDDYVDNLTTTTWIVRVEGVSGADLSALRANIEADSRFDNAQDWETAHEEVERNGGLIFGTPGLLSLQFVVASIAAVASAFVFLSLVLNQRQKELAVLQAIGASPNQIIRLVLFEILSIVVVSMALGMFLGMGLALSFNGLFDVFGYIFQLFGGSSTPIARELVWPWTQLGIVALAVFSAVVFALLLTTRKALRSDLASVLKGE